jgi:hypothetical protein
MHRPDRTLEAELQALGDDALGRCAADDGDGARSEQSTQVGHAGEVS